MQKLKDLLKIGKAKVKDMGAKYIRPDYHSSYTETLLTMKNSNPSSDDFAEAIDNLWLLTRQDVNYTKKRIQLTRNFFNTYNPESWDSSKKASFGEIGEKFIRGQNEVLQSRKEISESTKIARESYYSYRRKEISYEEFFESLKTMLLTQQKSTVSLVTKLNQSLSEPARATQ